MGVLVFFAGSSDRFFVFLGVSYETQIWFWRFGVWMIPAIVAVPAYRSCRALRNFEEVEATREAAEQEARTLSAEPETEPAQHRG